MVAKATAEQQLFRLLQSMFQSGELRRFLRHRSDYAVLCNDLPGEESSLSTVADAAIQALGRHGLITRRLFDAFLEERPYRRDEIESVAGMWDALAAQKEELSAREFHVPEPLDCTMPYAKLTHYFEQAAQLYRSFERNLAHGSHAIAAFELHQVVEKIYKAVLLVFTGDQPRLHDPDALGHLCARVVPDIGSLVPADVPDGKRLASLLRAAYADARYSVTFAVSREDLEALARYVCALRTRAECACHKRLVELAAAARADG